MPLGSVKRQVRALITKVEGAIGRDNVEARKAILDAIANNRVRNLELLLQKGVPVNGWDHYSPVTDAVSLGRAECLSCLVKAGVDVNKPDFLGETPLSYAISEGNLECVNILVQAGANVNGTDNCVPLIRATRLADTVCLKLLLNAGANVNAVDSKGYTPLMSAVNIPHANILIKAGANVNAVDNKGYTPLMYAASRGDVKCVNLLIQAGADVNIRNDTTALFEAIGKNSHGCFCSLIQAGADINITNFKGETPLLTAAKNNAHSIRLFLTLLGADVNTADNYGKTALIYSVINNSSRSLEGLIAAGASVNKADNKGCSALMFASHMGSLSLAKALIDSGADVNARERGEGFTALMYGCYLYDMMQLLLEAGARVNLQYKMAKGDKGNILDYILYSTSEENKAWKMPPLEKFRGQILLLIGAGEKIDDKYVQIFKEQGTSGDKQCLIPKEFIAEVPVEIYDRKPQGNLSDTCRAVIRRQLIDANRANLFYGVSRLGLPRPLQSYLLYHMSIRSNDTV